MTTGYLDNFYARLGVSKNATPDEIRAAYHQAARRLHPDTNKETDTTELFLQIQEAYETLYAVDKRISYDKTLPQDIDVPPDILVNTIYSREVLPIMERAQLIYVLLDMMAMPEPKTGRQRRPVLNVCLVLDTSTSMNGARLDAVKDTAIKLANGLSGQDILSVVSFNDRAEVIIPAARGQNMTMINARISMLGTRGGTEILQGLQMGMNEINRNINPSFLNHIILITDGRTYGDEAGSLQLANQAAERGISISGLGIGSEWNDEFLDDLATRTGGTSVYASQPKNIKNLLEKKFGQINSTYANNLRLEFKIPENIEMRYAFRLAPDANALGIEKKLHLGNIPLGGSLQVLIEFMIHQIPENIFQQTLLEGQLHLNIPSRPIPNTDFKIDMTRPAKTDAEVTPPPQVLIKAMSRLSIYRLQEQAQKDLAAGNMDQAAQKLNNVAVQLLSAGENGLAQTVMLELDNLKSGKSLSQEAKKRIKYSTRALLLPTDEENQS